MIQYRVSIIVAVYNVEKYIRRCLESLKSQTYSNIEVILVDDGSTDKSGLICDEYARKDSRFRVIHKENGGVSTARQIGLDAATGDYIIHADPDDYVDVKMIEELLTSAISTNVDMTTCDFYMDGKYYKQHYKSSSELLKRLVEVSIICACWNVLVRRSFIVEHNIQFIPNWINQSEDFLFMSRLLVAGASAIHVNKAYYHYKSNNLESLSNIKSKLKLDSLVEVIHEYESFLMPQYLELLYYRKRNVLKRAFVYKFQEYIYLFPETHQHIINDAQELPMSDLLSQLSLALQGKIKLAYAYNRFYKILDKIKRPWLI